MPSRVKTLRIKITMAEFLDVMSNALMVYCHHHRQDSPLFRMTTWMDTLDFDCFLYAIYAAGQSKQVSICVSSPGRVLVNATRSPYWFNNICSL